MLTDEDEGEEERYRRRGSGVDVNATHTDEWRDGGGGDRGDAGVRAARRLTCLLPPPAPRLLRAATCTPVHASLALVDADGAIWLDARRLDGATARSHDAR
jgi:hypothetical protein